MPTYPGAAHAADNWNSHAEAAVEIRFCPADPHPHGPPDDLPKPPEKRSLAEPPQPAHCGD